MEGKLSSQGRAEPIELDDFPPFSVRQRMFGPIELTRGCIWACRFCQTPSLHRACFRHRSVPEVRRWVRQIRKAKLRDVRFITPSALSYGSSDGSVHLAAVEELLAASREEIGPSGRVFFGTFPSELRPEQVTAEALAVIRRYVDNDNLIIGGQSGSDRLLRECHRGHDAESVERAVRLSAEAGFVPNVDFIFGLPGETPEDVRATLTLVGRLTELGARVHAHAFMPLPGTAWRSAPRGSLEPVRKHLLSLAGRGRAYGQWRRQLELAASVSRR